MIIVSVTTSGATVDTTGLRNALVERFGHEST